MRNEISVLLDSSYIYCKKLAQIKKKIRHEFIAVKRYIKPPVVRLHLQPGMLSGEQ